MDDALRELLGRQVQVFTNAGQSTHSDKGTLEASDGTWLRLRTDGGEMMCFSVYNVRLVKLLGGGPIR